MSGPSTSRRLILASASPRRVELLRGAGFNPEVRSPEVVEFSGSSGLAAERLALENARLKGRAVFDAWAGDGDVVVAADTVVELDGRIFGKPRSETEAVSMLQQLGGKVHRVLTGVWMASRSDGGGDLFEQWIEETEISFHCRQEAFIRAYVNRVGSMDKAGGYAAQSDQGEMIAGVRGLFSSVIGLPIERVAEVLKRWGIDPRAGAIDRRCSS